MPKLVFIDRNFAGRIYSLSIEKTTVGRGDENVLVIRDSSLSARHCEILVNGAEVIVRDLGSRNGTLVGGRLLKNQQMAVKNGQIIRFGLVDARIEIEDMEWNDETIAETAVFEHRQVMRDQRRAQKNPAPVDPSARLDSAEFAGEGESGSQTIFVPRPLPAAPASPSNEVSVSEAGDGVRARRLIPVWVAIVAAGLLLAAWFIWGRK